MISSSLISLSLSAHVSDQQEQESVDNLEDLNITVSENVVSPPPSPPPSPFPSPPQLSMESKSLQTEESDTQPQVCGSFFFFKHCPLHSILLTCLKSYVCYRERCHYCKRILAPRKTPWKICREIKGSNHFRLNTEYMVCTSGHIRHLCWVCVVLCHQSSGERISGVESSCTVRARLSGRQVHRAGDHHGGADPAQPTAGAGAWTSQTREWKNLSRKKESISYELYKDCLLFEIGEIFLIFNLRRHWV